MEYRGQLTPAEFWAEVDEQDRRIRESAGALPLFRLVDWTGPICVST